MALGECPACKGAVSTAAAACPHCGHPLQRASEHGAGSKSGGCLKLTLMVLATIGVLLALMIGCSVLSLLGSRGSKSTTGAGRGDDASSMAGPVLKVGKWHWSEEYGYVTAEGRVTNISSERLENVQAIVTFETTDGTLVTTEDGLVEYNPLLPGQTSPWKVMVRANPAMAKAHVDFKTMFGGTLNTTR